MAAEVHKGQPANASCNSQVTRRFVLYAPPIFMVGEIWVLRFPSICMVSEREQMCGQNSKGE